MGDLKVAWGSAGMVNCCDALGRDGSPSRPFADVVMNLGRVNGGLGEPALPETPRSKENRKPDDWLGPEVGT